MRKLISKDISYFGKIKFNFEFDTKAIPLLEKSRYVYFVLTDIPIYYQNNQKSKIMYIGQTKTNAWELFTSGFGFAGLVRGVIEKKIPKSALSDSLSFYFIDIEKDIPPVDVEKALLYVFFEVYGEKPICNKQGGNKEVVKKVEEKFFISKNDLIETLKELENE